MPKKRKGAWAVLVLALLGGGHARAEEPFAAPFAGGALEDLRSSDVAARLSAAQRLGRPQRGVAIVTALEAALREERVPLVLEALASALRRAGAPSSVAVMQERFERASGPDASVLADALASFAVPEALRALADGLLRPDARAASVAALRAVGAPAVPHVLRVMRAGTPHPDVLRLLGDLRSSLATPTLVAWARAPQESLRTAALDALAAIGDPRAREAAVAALADADVRVRFAALGALEAFGSRADGAAVEPLARAGAEADEVARARRALAKIAPEVAAPLLLAALADEDEGARRVAAEIALARPSPLLAPLLIELASSEEHGDRAASALAGFGTLGLEALLGAADPSIPRARIARALAVGLRQTPDAPSDLRRAALDVVRAGAPAASALRLRALADDPDVVAEIHAALAADDVARRREAAEALSLVPPTRAIDRGAFLRRLADEHDEDVVRALLRVVVERGLQPPSSSVSRWTAHAATAPEALIALATLPPPSVVAKRRLRESLRAALDGADPRLRAAAAWAIARSGDDRAWRALLVALEDPNADVRRAAAEALTALRFAPEARRWVASARRATSDSRVRDALDRALVARDPASPARSGRFVLDVRWEGATNELVDVVLPDSRFHRIRTTDDGSLFVPDLPWGVADVRVLLAPR